MSKPLIKSKTIQGQTILLIAFGSALVNGAATGFNVADIVTAGIAVGGYAWGVYGRYKAGVPIAGIITKVSEDFTN